MSKEYFLSNIAYNLSCSEDLCLSFLKQYDEYVQDCSRHGEIPLRILDFYNTKFEEEY